MPGERIITSSGNRYYWNFTTTNYTPNHLIWATTKEKGKHIFQLPLCIKGQIAGRTMSQIETKFRDLVEVEVIAYNHINFKLK